MTLDSVLFANIGQMAKVLTIAENAHPKDGLFEVVIFPHAHKFKLLGTITKAAATGLTAKKQYRSYTFEVLKKMPFQFDGEVHIMLKNTRVTIT